MPAIPASRHYVSILMGSTVLGLFSGALWTWRLTGALWGALGCVVVVFASLGLGWLAAYAMNHAARALEQAEAEAERKESDINGGKSAG